MQIPTNPKALFLSHGGGPLPLLGDKDHQELVDSLTEIASKINKPSAVVVISAHWEEEVTTIMHNARPPMMYDYYGFPQAAYQLQYPAPGAPQLAEEIHTLLESNAIETKLDKQRGFDHGLFVPLLVMYPNADVPCIQISLTGDLDASKHIRLGKVLSALQQDGLLILGSGFSFHNMQAFRVPETQESKAMNEEFEAWLRETCTSKTLNEDERADRLIHWEDAPSARYCHPREEHLLPLHVCYGASNQACTSYFELSVLNKKCSIYIW